MNSKLYTARVPERPLQRVAFQLHLREGMEEAYEQSHQAVWPEMLALLKRAGVSDYSIFRRERLLVLVMSVLDFEETWQQIEADPVNQRWQRAMAPYFEPMTDMHPGERFPMMREVFYLS